MFHLIKGKDRLEKQDKTIQKTEMFSLRSPSERPESVPPQGITAQQEVQKLPNLQDPPDAAGKGDRERRPRQRGVKLRWMETKTHQTSAKDCRSPLGKVFTHMRLTGLSTEGKLGLTQSKRA